jgi:phospholipid/cholesterol/gamma-HCH transport system permease protein
VKKDLMASVEYEELKEGGLRVILRGRLSADTTAPIWNSVLRKLRRYKDKTVHVDAHEVDYCDGAGAALFLQIEHVQASTNGTVEIEGLRGEFRQLMTLFDPGRIEGPKRRPTAFVRFAEDVGKGFVRIMRDLHAEISFLGEMSAKLLAALAHPSRLRLGDTFLIAEKSGADAVGITAMLGFLIGVILAFQSAIAMSKFGAQIFVADLVVIATLRELGPLITAFVLAARSGSAFAAEIGTMKVNEELDALTTMGLDPVRFLVIPRMLAAVFVIPLLTMFNNLLALVGTFFVMVSMGFAPITVFNQIMEAATLTDLFGGLAKTLVFGGLIASIGCLRGLQTGTGASAVGDSATKAVVSGIVAIVIADGVFAVAFYFLGI